MSSVFKDTSGARTIVSASLNIGQTEMMEYVSGNIYSGG